MSVHQLFEHFNHYNAGEMRRATEALEQHLNNGGALFITLAGAMSTARMGRLLAPAIRRGLVHGVCCTGANLEEDVFNAVEGHRYKHVDWRSLSAKDEEALVNDGWNRVTDVCIPETVMHQIWKRLLTSWQDAETDGASFTPFEHMNGVIDLMESEGVRIPRLEESWVYAAGEENIPVFVPGWSDSTTGNMFSASVRQGKLKGHSAVFPDTFQFAELAAWYERTIESQIEKLAHTHVPGTTKTHGQLGTTPKPPGIAFLQIGGGIAGDWPICVVPSLRQDEGKTHIPHWSYFCQIGDAPASYGGYSGAPPNEKITWDKLSPETPRFTIQSDATIVLPLMLAHLLEGAPDAT